MKKYILILLISIMFILPVSVNASQYQKYTNLNAGMLSSYNIGIFNTTSLIDSDITTLGEHNEDFGAWMKIDLGAGNDKAFVQSKFYGGLGVPYTATWTIEYSDNDVDWYSTNKAVVLEDADSWYSSDIWDVGGHRYWRWSFSGRRNSHIMEAEMYIYEPTACVENWTCTGWSACVLGQQTRTCTDLNDCGTTISKPSEVQSCTPTCTESWSCGAWSTCINGQQTRTCTDANSCGSTANKPTVTQSCTATCTESWTCGSWSSCVNGQQSRTCTDANSCGTMISKPVITQSCTATCTESWTCSSWNTCSGGTQTRTCTDTNSCGTTVSKPAITQSCTVACTESWTCTDWSGCINNQQSRTCTDANTCGTTNNKPVMTQSCKVDVKPPISASVPNVLAKGVYGVVDGHDGQLVFEISNEDTNHKLEGYLSCNIPSDVVVTSSTGAASGSQGQYISETFTVDTAPSRKSMNLGISSQSTGSKLFSCTLNYVLFKEGKGYLNNNGDYGSEKKYYTVNVNRDVNFNTEEGIAKTPQETVKTGKTIEISQQNVIWGLVAFVVLLLVYLLGRTSRSNQRENP